MCHQLKRFVTRSFDFYANWSTEKICWFFLNLHTQTIKPDTFQLDITRDSSLSSKYMHLHSIAVAQKASYTDFTPVSTNIASPNLVAYHILKS